MDWHNLADKVLGFMPHRFVFWSAVSTSIITLIAQKGGRWLEQLIAPPYRKYSNIKQREKLIKELGNSNGEQGAKK